MGYTFKHGDRPIDGYTIQRAVGKGGFGEVYYAVSDGGREVAIKYLHDNPQVELRGVSNCINLKSPHLVSIFDVRKTTDDEYAIIMEYCSGPSLRDLLIAEPNGFEPQKAAFFVREIAKGLSYLHDRGIVHRDLKPGNIFYDDGYVKIGDYGLSKFISISRHSGQTASVGTVHYMAPEIGSGNYSRGVDIYALGVILYEMLLGKVPFEGSSMAEVLMKHLTAQPEIEDLPHPFGPVIRKALQKDPNDRFPTVDEMVQELLDVAAVRESLAGFSTKSLEGAVHARPGHRADSPMPSPNPMPRMGTPFAQPVRGQGAQEVVFSPRLAKKMDRISRKLEAKLGKIGGGHRGSEPVAPRAPQAAPPPHRPQPVLIPSGDRKKRMLLSGLLSIGLAVGLGVLVGNTHSAEAGAASAMLVFAMSGGIVLSQTAVRWFGVEFGPKWSQRMIQLCCCAPLMAVATAPLFGSSHRDSQNGLAMWLALLVIVIFCNWTTMMRDASSGEMNFGSAIGKAFFALIVTAALGGMLGHDPEEIMFISGAIAGAVTLIIQATSWWLPAKATRAFEQLGKMPSPQQPGRGAPPPVPQAPNAPAREAPAPRADRYFRYDIGRAAEGQLSEGIPSRRTVGPERWMVTRAFWGLMSFALMGGAIVTFVISLIAENVAYHDQTAAIIGCTGFAAFMLFALRKTTPLKRVGFWRESVRPFLQSSAMFGIGASITAIAREWRHIDEYASPCLPDEGRVASVTALVMCSVLFLALLFLRGRRPRPPKPFLQDGGSYPGPAADTSPIERPDDAGAAGNDDGGRRPETD